LPGPQGFTSHRVGSNPSPRFPISYLSAPNRQWRHRTTHRATHSRYRRSQ